MTKVPYKRQNLIERVSEGSSMITMAGNTVADRQAWVTEAAAESLHPNPQARGKE